MNKIKILYAEDEVFLGKIVKESLESRNFRVTMITDGLHVLPAFEQYQPDICILDVMLPNQDGFSLGRAIKKRQPSMPILYLTAKTQTQDLLNGFAAGGNDYIKKPFSMEELIVRINNLLHLVQAQPTKAQKGNVLHLGRYQFLPLRYELVLDQQVRKLSHRETQLLNIFANQPNLPIERRDILRQVWGDDSFFNSRNLDVYIKKLRDYLRDDPNVKIITLKGIGYRFSTN
ncbi:MAG: response regulator transcription factor [Bacteroidota bacterium]